MLYGRKGTAGGENVAVCRDGSMRLGHKLVFCLDTGPQHFESELEVSGRCASEPTPELQVTEEAESRLHSCSVAASSGSIRVSRVAYATV